MGRVIITVIIPTFNEEKHIVNCLDSLLANDVSFDFEVLVVDGGSADKTRHLVDELSKRHSQIRLLNNEKRFAPHAFNIGIKNAKGNYIIILGAHSYVDKQFLQKNLDTIKRTGAECVGGRIHSIADSPIAEAIKQALSSPFGVGNAKFRYATKPEYVDTVAFGCYNKEVFEKVGLFDEELVRNQDDEFNQRLIQAGGKIYFNPDIISYYYVRNNINKLFKQYFQYGYWKVIVQRKRKQVASIRHLVPMLFVLFLVAGGILSSISSFIRVVYFTVLGFYLVGAVVFATKASNRLTSVIRIPLLFFILHLAYGLGYWKGLVHHLLGKTPTSTKMTQSTR